MNHDDQMTLDNGRPISSTCSEVVQKGEPMVPIIRRVTSEDRIEWSRMRNLLWPDVSCEELEAETTAWLEDPKNAVFVANRLAGGLCGFVEVALRPCTVNGELGRFGYIEGWYVDPDSRQQGIGTILIEAAEDWARRQDCDEIHSDARIDNRLRGYPRSYDCFIPLLRQWLRCFCS